jgi:hypothetical protein
MGVPLQKKGERSRVSALLQGKLEDGMADAAAKHRAIGKAAPKSRRRFDEKAEGGTARLFFSRMS